MVVGLFHGLSLAWIESAENVEASREGFAPAFKFYAYVACQELVRRLGLLAAL